MKPPKKITYKRSLEVAKLQAGTKQHTALSGTTTAGDGTTTLLPTTLTHLK